MGAIMTSGAEITGKDFKRLRETVWKSNGPNRFARRAAAKLAKKAKKAGKAGRTE